MEPLLASPEPDTSVDAVGPAAEAVESVESEALATLDMVETFVASDQEPTIVALDRLVPLVIAVDRAVQVDSAPLSIV